MTYIYIIHYENDTNRVKIGISKNPKTRLSQLQTGHSDKLILAYSKEIGSRQDTKLLESHIHKRLSRYNTSGEWFDISIEAAIFLINNINEDYKSEDVLLLEQEKEKLNIESNIIREKLLKNREEYQILYNQMTDNLKKYSEINNKITLYRI